MHKRLPAGGSLQTAVSDAPPLHPANLHSLIVGRIRYSTNVCGSPYRIARAKGLFSPAIGGVACAVEMWSNSREQCEDPS